MRANVRMVDIPAMQFERKRQAEHDRLAVRVDVLWKVLAVLALLLTGEILWLAS